MRRDVQREIRLSAFSLERGNLELLWRRLLDLFEGEAGITSKLRLTLPAERLTFESIQELSNYSDLRGSVTTFSLAVGNQRKSIELSSGGLLSSTPTLKVWADTDTWCAAAVQAVTHVTRQGRTWYFWLTHVPFGTLAMLWSLMPWLGVGPFVKFNDFSLGQMLSWFALTATFGTLAMFKSRLLPAAEIVFAPRLGFVRRYAGELGLLLGIVALVLSVYMWMVPYRP